MCSNWTKYISRVSRLDLKLGLRARSKPLYQVGLRVGDALSKCLAGRCGMEYVSEAVNEGAVRVALPGVGPGWDVVVAPVCVAGGAHDLPSKQLGFEGERALTDVTAELGTLTWPPVVCLFIGISTVLLKSMIAAVN